MPKRNSCNGGCCRRFYLPLSPSEIMDRYQAWLNSDGSGFDREGNQITEDIWLIAPMLRYLGTSNVGANGTILEKPVHWYTCTHFDGKDCQIYKIRPKMCRDYPYGKCCKYPGCSYKNNKK